MDIDIPKNNCLDKVYWGINPAYIYRGLKQYPKYLEAIRNSKRVYADGIAIVWLWNYFLKIKPRIPERVSTTDIFPVLLQKNLIYKKRIFLLGSEEKVVEKLYQKYKKFGIVGYHHGYFEKVGNENDKVINLINASNVDILFVGLGNPTQEKWIIENCDKLKVKLIIPCGGLFDHYVKYKRAPKWLQRVGGEWLWRLLQDKFSRYRVKQINESAKMIINFIITKKLNGVKDA